VLRPCNLLQFERIEYERAVGMAFTQVRPDGGHFYESSNEPPELSDATAFIVPNQVGGMTDACFRVARNPPGIRKCRLFGAPEAFGE
jgi:hypothetical protein